MTGTTQSFWSRHAGAILGIAATIGIQIVVGLIAAGMILQQIADLREQVNQLRDQRSELVSQGKSLVRVETKLEGFDNRFAALETMVRQLLQQKFGSLP